MVNYMALVPLLIENQRRQYEQIQQLQTKLSEMEKRLIRLEQLMEEDQE
jgi:cell shape-determining protein MreC